MLIFIFISDFQILFISDYERANKATQVVERENSMQKVLTFYDVALPHVQDSMKRTLRIIHNREQCVTVPVYKELIKEAQQLSLQNFPVSGC